ncbi:hypothetical protein [Arthrobacter flavus]|uniref:Uncharacterized protein n=1 Tax=Arthrobacter flavus TaxID=95172 RepID=A0ABW4Q540_9MICC
MDSLTLRAATVLDSMHVDGAPARALVSMPVLATPALLVGAAYVAVAATVQDCPKVGGR